MNGFLLNIQTIMLDLSFKMLKLMYVNKYNLFL